MDTDQTMRVLYLGLLAVAIGGSYIYANRGNLSKMAQQAAIWGFIFLGTIGAIGLWGDISRDVSQRQAVIGQEIVIPQSRDGHYYLTLDVNDTQVNFVVDTGATMMVLTQADARRAGIDTNNLTYLGLASTANGQVRTADVRLDQVSVGPYADTNVRAVVNAGEMDTSLLGMSYLNLYASMHFNNGELILSR